MPLLTKQMSEGVQVPLRPNFPAVTCPVQVSLTTGVLPEYHGIIANGLYYREKGEFEMWTAWNEAIQAPQIWETLKTQRPELNTAVWFPLLCKGAKADYICTPAPIHNPDGTESLWCYTKPTELYGQYRDELGHFPLMNFWGPMASIKSSQWICDSAVKAAEAYHPDFLYLYVPHLDYAPQKFGPNAPESIAALKEFDTLLSSFMQQYQQQYDSPVQFLLASEYAITEVDHVSYPNRILREAGLLGVQQDHGGEVIDVANTPAWVMVDHQCGHVFVKNAEDVSRVADLFRNVEGIEQVLVGTERARLGLDCENSGEIVLVSTPNSWQAYYYWEDDAKAPQFAHTVDIHRKPGYDPVEMFFDPVKKGTPLDATLIKGSHGYPATSPEREGVLLSSLPLEITGEIVQDTDVAGLCLKHFGVVAE